MSETDTEQEKPFAPSQKKLEDARKRGDVPRSTDVTTAAVYGGMLLAAVGIGGAALQDAGGHLRGLLDYADTTAQAVFTGSPQPILGGLMAGIIWVLAPFFVIPALLAILSILAQQALVFAPQKLVPKLNRISPIQGAKTKFGRNGLFEFAKSFAKLLIYSAILGIFLFQQRERVIGLLFLEEGPATADLMEMLLFLMPFVLGIALLIGAVDLVWQRAEHQRKLRMSRKELMDELKQSEGDPTMKHQRRQRGIDLATNAMMSDVPKASVVVVNPTHYAVALKWDPAQDTAPLCVAKGTDAIAARIRDIAREHDIPIHSDPPTARALHASVEIGAEIRPDHYQAVAAAIRFADALRRKMRGQR